MTDPKDQATVLPQDPATVAKEDVVIENQDVLPKDNPSHEADPEELEWSKLSGPVQKRVRTLLDQRNRAIEEATFFKQRAENVVVPPPAPAPVQDPVEVNEEQQKALRNLRKAGVLTQEDLRELEDKMILENEYQRLENQYNGEDGRPVFDRNEIQQHMAETGIYNPEKAYNDLFSDELFDWRMKSVSKNKKPTFSERPVAPSNNREEPLTLSGIQERLKQPDGKEWWDKNREKILPLMGQLQAGS